MAQALVEETLGGPGGGTQGLVHAEVAAPRRTSQREPLATAGHLAVESVLAVVPVTGTTQSYTAYPQAVCACVW